MEDAPTNTASLGALSGTKDRFGGLMIPSKSLPDNDHDFAKALHISMEAWKLQGIRGVWMTIPIDKSSFISIAAEVGFRFHHATESHAVVNIWLPAEEPNKMPLYPFHSIGVGGLVINDKKQILVVREKYGGAKAPWKLPGGSADPREELGETATREVFEECGIKTEFVSILGFRHFHGAPHNTSDLYFIARLKPLTEEIHFDTSELLDACWMDIDLYISDDHVTDLNRWIGIIAKNHLLDPSSSEFTAKSLPTWNKRGHNLFYAIQNDSEAKL